MSLRNAFFLLIGLTSQICLSQNIISEIKIEGNKRTKTEFLKRLAFVKQGKVLDSTKINSDVRRFKLLPSVASASFEVNRLDNDNYSITYKVVENFAIIPGLNVSQDVNEDLAYRVSLFDFNLLGQNQLIGGFYSRNVFDSYGVFWEAPNLFTRKFGMGLNYQNNILQQPIFFDDGRDINYKFNSNALELRLFYEFDFNNRMELGINFADEDYNYLNGDLPNDIPESLGVKRTSVVGEYAYNNISIDYQYVEGFRSTFTYNFTIRSRGNNGLLRNFFIGRNDFEYFKRVGHNGNWANRLRIGYATNDTTPFAPFALDNQINIRGVGNVVDRGTAMVVLNTEYRHTVFEKDWFAMQFNAYVDSGTWQNPGGNLEDLIQGENASLYTGLGLRLIHKRIFNAVFRIDYGISLGDKANNGIVFGIGQYF